MADQASARKPKGEAAVRAALIDAAAAAYSGSGAFSARAIAVGAGVNHGQIHHYFGSMAGLKQAMLEQLGRGLDERVAAVGAADPATTLRAAAQVTLADPRFVRALARRLLESPPAAADQGASEARLQQHFPVVERLRRTLPDAPASRQLLAEGLSRALGWALFGPWIGEALQLTESEVSALQRRLAEPPVGMTWPSPAAVGSE